MEGAGVHQQAVVGADAGILQGGHVSPDDAHFDPRRLDPLAGSAQRALDHVDAGHLPPTFGEPDAPDATAGADVEGTTVGTATLLLTSDQLQQLAGEGRMLGKALPGMEAERVGEPVVHESSPTATPAAARFLITTGMVSPRTSVGLNSTISVPAW